MQGPIGAKVSNDLPSQLVSGGDAGTDRREGVERFAEPAGERDRRPGAAADLARRDVDQRGVAEHRALPVLLLHHLGRPLDHQREFRLVHEGPGHGVFRKHDGIAGTDHGIGVLHEHVERARLALRMLPIVRNAGENLARPGQRRTEPHVRQRNGLALVGQALQGRTQRVEAVDDALHGKLRRVAFLDRTGDVDHAAVGHQPGSQFGVRRRLE